MQVPAGRSGVRHQAYSSLFIKDREPQSSQAADLMEERTTHKGHRSCGRSRAIPARLAPARPLWLARANGTVLDLLVCVPSKALQL